MNEIVYSHEVGLAKPDPAIFRLTCERLSVEPEQVVFVDDLPVNVESAARLGMQALLHVETAETIASLHALVHPGC